jgi:hypothetical protein
MSIVLMGSTSGSITLAEPAIAGSSTINLPVGTGTAVVNGVNGALVSGTAVASTSGTSIDFTSIPSWVKRVTINLNGVSTNGTTNILFRLGTSGGIVSTGYLARQANIVSVTANGTNETTGFLLGSGTSAADIFYGSIIFSNLNANIWCAQGVFSQTGATSFTSLPSGAISLGGTLDRVRVTTANGTDAFDAGSINILYE